MAKESITVNYGYVTDLISKIDTIKEEFLTNQREGLSTISALRNEGLLKTEKTDSVLTEVENQFSKVQEYINYLENFKEALNQFINTYQLADK